MKRLLSIAALLPGLAFAQQGAVLSTPSGQYVFGQISQLGRDKFLLDTKTGRMWNIVCAAFDKDDKDRCLLRGLEPVVFFDSKGESAGYLPPGNPNK